jgi:hypothetical protein
MHLSFLFFTDYDVRFIVRLLLLLLVVVVVVVVVVVIVIVVEVYFIRMDGLQWLYRLGL